MTMKIQFTTDIEEYVTTHREARAKHFLEFGSKKQLEEADVLTIEDLELVKSIKGTFNFSLHVAQRYMAVTLYRTSEDDRKYQYLVVDLKEKAIAKVESVKEAKQAILDLVEQDMEDEVQRLLKEEMEKPRETLQDMINE